MPARTKDNPMNIDAEQIISMLHSQGQHTQANAAQGQLPAQVDTDNASHQDMLSQFGINPADLLSKFGGLGGLGKML
jgi:hypothetical protein